QGYLLEAAKFWRESKSKQHGKDRRFAHVTLRRFERGRTDEHDKDTGCNSCGRDILSWMYSSGGSEHNAGGSQTDCGKHRRATDCARGFEIRVRNVYRAHWPDD